MFPPTPTYLSSIHHDGSPRYVRSQGEPQLNDIVQIRLRTSIQAPIERVLLRLCPDGEQQFIEMHPEGIRPKDACRWWVTGLRLSMPLTSYRFLIFTTDGAWWYNGSGAQRSLPTDAADFRLLANFQAPTWVRSSVFYQIFPDRFADGDPASNVKDGEFEYRGLRSVARRWGEPPSRGGYQAMVDANGTCPNADPMCPLTTKGYPCVYDPGDVPFAFPFSSKGVDLRRAAALRNDAKFLGLFFDCRGITGNGSRAVDRVWADLPPGRQAPVRLHVDQRNGPLLGG